MLAARRAGFSRVAVVRAAPALAAALEGAGAELVAEAPVEAVRLPWNVVARTKELEALRAGAPAAGVPVVSAADLPGAERFLLKGLIKDSERFFSRHLDRPVSLAVSRRLAGTRLTPNQMTLVAVGIGLAAAPFFLSFRPAVQVIGGVLFLLHSILDGCDGELARLKFLESRWGGVLDFWGDNLVHMAVFAAMSFGLARATGRAWPLACGAASVVATAASTFFVYARTMRGPKEGPLYTSVSNRPGSTIARVVDALSGRDFIYLVLLLSAFGKADWFVVVAAFAVPAYFVALVAVALSDRRALAS